MIPLPEEYSNFYNISPLSTYSTIYQSRIYSNLSTLSILKLLIFFFFITQTLKASSITSFSSWNLFYEVYKNETKF